MLVSSTTRCAPRGDRLSLKQEGTRTVHGPRSRSCTPLWIPRPLDEVESRLSWRSTAYRLNLSPCATGSVLVAERTLRRQPRQRGAFILERGCPTATVGAGIILQAREAQVERALSGRPAIGSIRLRWTSACRCGTAPDNGESVDLVLRPPRHRTAINAGGGRRKERKALVQIEAEVASPTRRGRRLARQGTVATISGSQPVTIAHKGYPPRRASSPVLQPTTPGWWPWHR